MYVFPGAIARLVPGATLIHPLVAVVLVDIVPLFATQLDNPVCTRNP